MHKQGKILLVTGTSLKSQYEFIRKFCKNNADFIPLNTIKLFNNEVKKITKEYFSKDIEIANKLTKKKHNNFLELLFYLQKLNDPCILKFYKEFYKKIQLINKIVLYRVYESFFLYSKKIVASGKNCIFAENIFIDPFPLRRDIFYTFFNIYGENFKIVHIYTDIGTSIKQLIEGSNHFIQYVFSKQTGYLAYRENIELEETSGYPVNRYENPLFSLELFPLIYNITNKIPKNNAYLQEIKGSSLKNIYFYSINQNKKLFGLFILKQYPQFYYKHSILNEIGKKFLFIKNFKKDETIYFINNRVDFHYNIIHSHHFTNDGNFFIPSDFILSIESWIKQDIYTPYSDAFLQNSLLRYNYDNQTNYNAISRLSPKNKAYIRGLNSKYQTIFIEDIYNIKKTNKILNNLINCNNSCILLRINTHLWICYVVTLLPNTKIEIKYSYSSKNISKTDFLDLHLILINYIYIRLSKQLNTHFLINFVDLITKTKLNKKELSIKTHLGVVLSYLQKKYNNDEEELYNE